MAISSSVKRFFDTNGSSHWNLRPGVEAKLLTAPTLNGLIDRVQVLRAGRNMANYDESRNPKTCYCEEVGYVSVS